MSWGWSEFSCVQTKTFTILSACGIILLVVELSCSLRYFLFTLHFNSIRALESSTMKMENYAIILCCLAPLPCTFWVKSVRSGRIFLAIRFAATAFGLFLILFQSTSLCLIYGSADFCFFPIKSLYVRATPQFAHPSPNVHPRIKVVGPITHVRKACFSLELSSSRFSCVHCSLRAT